MRLITHNMLQCHVKNCNNNNFPLRFEDVQVELIEADFNPEFLANMLNKIDWDALRNTAIQLGINTLPEQVPEDAEENEEFLKVLHSVILETHIQQGQMVCPNCSHVYKIKDGIPNMLLAEHEI
ncbi:hypothetical protein G6F46_002094 [Rhizopus delemar]|uniref:Trm112p-domain-containing protein n=3 Tax=Rhizopus TaxID=4842 RepID=I1CKA9_RHIO9|nr:hypothetical protein RO3G_13600 [Rhizopus delemar RA 99-880]KAG1057008.1 hypothetical protein G6F43_001140 [Rhizopus delemar]KAG1553882.1 hypothetical protein G6F51_000306 [Rhizopus arrhizus]KAG1465428.1 hypothetical protein G6F55_001137 [Rhizopus delemar]KAG1501420.1 hypothetical protein G6F54_003050 [Rhizopus delemar]|eukprot:EIE88889.1 hypothetical protein RO3G_13600 [Rhizopus delemar RA 99-880]